MEDKKHIVAVSAIIRNKTGDRVLVVKRGRNEVAYPGKWAFPGGKVERGQTVTDALKREIMEEVGLEIEDNWSFLNDYTFMRPDGHNVVGMNFLARAKTDNVRLSGDFEDFRWVTPEEFESLDCIEGMREEVRMVFGR